MTWKTKRGIGMAYYVSLILNYQNICALKNQTKKQSSTDPWKAFLFLKGMGVGREKVGSQKYLKNRIGYPYLLWHHINSRKKDKKEPWELPQSPLPAGTTNISKSQTCSKGGSSTSMLQCECCHISISNSGNTEPSIPSFPATFDILEGYYILEGPDFSSLD